MSPFSNQLAVRIPSLAFSTRHDSVAGRASLIVNIERVIHTGDLPEFPFEQGDRRGIFAQARRMRPQNVAAKNLQFDTELTR